MTLNGTVALILRYSTELGSFGANYVKVVEDKRGIEGGAKNAGPENGGTKMQENVKPGIQNNESHIYTCVTDTSSSCGFQSQYHRRV